MAGQFFTASPDHPQGRTVSTEASNRRNASAAFIAGIQRKGRLATGHGQIDIGQDFRVQQGAVQFPVAIVYPQAATEFVQTDPGPGILLARQCEGIQNGAVVFHTPVLATEQFEFVVDKANVESGVMDHQFRAGNKLHKLIDNLRKYGLVCQEFVTDAVNRQGAFIHFPVWLDILVVITLGDSAIDDFHTADFDDAVPFAGIQTGRFRIQYNLTHYFIPSTTPGIGVPLRISSIARLANWSASSFSGCPLCPLTQCHSMRWGAAASSSACQRSAFFTGCLAAVLQPLRFQFFSHSVMPRRKYSESV